MTHTMAPAEPGTRHELIDIVHGFALFGVMLANMVWTTQWEGISAAQRDALPTVVVDTVVHLFAEVFIDYKFYTIFTMLFGLGFALQLSRAEAKGQNIVPVYVRRLGILLIFGVVHSIFIWFGDVLHMYALVGLLLILLRKWSDRALIGLAAGVAIVSFLVPFIWWLAMAAGLREEAARDDSTLFEAMSSGSLLAIWRMNWQFSIDEYTAIGRGDPWMLWWYLSVFWKFVVGMVIGRRMLLQEPQRHARFFFRLLVVALPFGVVVNVAWIFLGWALDIHVARDDSAYSILSGVVDLGIFSLSMSYICILALLFVGARTRVLVMPLAPLGRMALSNYLMQSVTLVVLFYGVGFGLIGKVGAAVCLVICVLQYAVQIVISWLWLKRYRFGPMEWVWRSLTYGRMQPMRHESRS